MRTGDGNAGICGHKRAGEVTESNRRSKHPRKLDPRVIEEARCSALAQPHVGPQPWPEGRGIGQAPLSQESPRPPLHHGIKTARNDAAHGQPGLRIPGQGLILHGLLEFETANPLSGLRGTVSYT